MLNGETTVQETARRQGELCWNLFVELRKELVESQKIRAQIVGLKITAVGTGIGVIVANKDKGASQQLLVIPAFAAIFFDLLIDSYSFSIKHIGSYCRNHLEKVLKESYVLKDYELWQEHLGSGAHRQNFSMMGNLGLTGLTVIIAAISLFAQSSRSYSQLFLPILLLFFYFDIWVERQIGKTDGMKIEASDAFRWLIKPVQIAKSWMTRSKDKASPQLPDKQ